MGFLDLADNSLANYSYIDAQQANAFETAELPGEGDVNAGGGGMTTSSFTNENDLRAYGLDTYTQSSGGGKVLGPPMAGGMRHIHDRASGKHLGTLVTPGASGGPMDHPYVAIALGVGGLAVLKMTEKKGEGTQISVGNGLRTALLVGTVFLAAKLLFGVWQVAAISPAVEMV